MAEIISINGSDVKIGQDDGKVVTVPIASIKYANPREGDKVQVYQDGDDYIVQRNGENCAVDGGKSVNKHVFVWVGNFLFGGFGVDRFMRGQTGLGVLKLLLTLFGWILFGLGTIAVWIWVMVDWITSMVKAYGSAYGSDECITFDANGNYTR